MTSEDRQKLAKDTLFYVDKIAEKLGYKLKGLKDPYETVKVLLHDENHPYNNEAVKLATKTFMRKNIKIFMSKYRKTPTGRYAYIFTINRVKA